MEILGWIFLIICFLNLFFNPMDDTDKSYTHRSGLSLYTDNKTGLQYLGAGFFGSLTPRLDENGKQMRIKNEN